MSRRRGNDDNEGGSGRGNQNYGGVPFRDAAPDTNEILLNDLDTFVVPARDEKGITQTIQFNIPPYMEQLSQTILRSGRFPYINHGGIFRHAFVRHLRWLAEIRQSVPGHLLPSIEIILELCRDNEMRVRVEEALDKLSRQIMSLHARGDHGEALRLMGVVKARMEGLYQSKWQQQFVREFSGIHNALVHSGGQIESVEQLRSASATEIRKSLTAGIRTGHTGNEQPE